MANGRTIWEILTGRNKRNMTPLELQYHNPLETKVGQVITFEHEVELNGVNFVIENIAVYETNVNKKRFYHTDYCLKGSTSEAESPICLRLRLLKNEEDEFGHTFQILHMYDQIGNEGVAKFLAYVTQNGDHNPHWDNEGEVTFKIHYGDEGEPLKEPLRYWRVEEATDPYKARQTILIDDEIDDNELDHRTIQYWDFSRVATSQDGTSVTELLWVELDEKTMSVSLFRGSEILSNQVIVC